MTHQPRRRWPYWLAAALVLSLLGGAGYVVYRTPVLGLQQVTVTAQSGELTEQVGDAVRAAVDIPDGTPLVTIDLAAARKRVLGVPQIATAAVSRHFPNDVSVSVTVRTPIAMTSVNGALWLLDKTGYPYLKVAKADAPAGLVTINLATPGPGDPSTLAALAVVSSLKTTTKVTLSSVSARSAYTVVLNLLDGRTVIWGSPTDSAKKQQILSAVLAQPGRTFDVSDPAFVTVSAS